MKTALFQRIVSLLDLDQDQSYTVLDFGCGNGELLSKISKAVAAHSRLLGTDASEAAIEQARLADSAADFECQKFTDALGYADEAFDIVVSVDTLECIPNKSALLAEVARVLRPGGRVLFAHWDWDTQVYCSQQKEVVRRLVAAFADWQQAWMEASDGQMGRKMWGLFQGSGQFRGEIQAHVLLETEYSPGRYGYDRLRDMSSLIGSEQIRTADYEGVLSEMERLQQQGKYFYSLTSYIYLGTKM